MRSHRTWAAGAACGRRRGAAVGGLAVVAALTLGACSGGSVSEADSVLTGPASAAPAAQEPGPPAEQPTAVAPAGGQPPGGIAPPAGNPTGQVTPPALQGLAAGTGSRPVSIDVPGAAVTAAPMVDLGLLADGSLDAPADVTHVGWFAQGPAPGDPGPAVLAGHVDSARGPGVFATLRGVQPGQQVRVARADGSVVTFEIDRVQQVAKAAFPTAEVYGPVPGAELRLVTCGGDFDAGRGHYEDNVVVFAHRVG